MTDTTQFIRNLFFYLKTLHKRFEFGAVLIGDSVHDQLPIRFGTA